MSTNPRNNYKNNYNTEKVAPSYNQKMTTKQDQEESEQKLPYFPTQVKKCTYAASSRPKTPFTFL
jgi:hypothetical protein